MAEAHVEEEDSIEVLGGIEIMEEEIISIEITMEEEIEKWIEGAEEEVEVVEVVLMGEGVEIFQEVIESEQVIWINWLKNKDN